MAENHTSNSPIIFRAVTAVLNREDVSDAVEYISQAYSPKKLRVLLPPGIDYDVAANRNAYLYKYFIALTRAVEHFLKVVDKIKPLFDEKSVVNICSICGGPGTEIFGLKLFLMSKNVNIPIIGTVLEYYINWKDTYQDLLNNMPFDDVKVIYKPFDFTEEINENCREALREADLVTLVKLISNFPHVDDCDQRLAVLLKEMKPGAVVLFIDNSGGNYFRTMNRAAEQANLNLIRDYQFEEESYIPDDERYAINAAYRGERNQTQKKLLISVSAWEKTI